MLCIVQNRLVGYHHFRISTEVVSCIRIAIPAWEVATGNIQANAMALLENVARCPQVYFVLVCFSCFDQRWLLATSKVAVAGANDAIGQILSVAIRMNINQASYKISIRGA